MLARGSSAVDFVGGASGIGGHGLLVSEKALHVLEGLKLPPHQRYAVEVVHKTGKPAAQRYSWLQVGALDNFGWIDFAESQFALKAHLDMADGAGEPLAIADENDLGRLMQAKRSDFYLHFTKLTLNSAYARAPFDLFYFEWLGGLASSRPIVSEGLKQAFEREYVIVSVMTGAPRFGRGVIYLTGAQPVEHDLESAAALAALKAVNRVLAKLAS